MKIYQAIALSIFCLFISNLVHVAYAKNMREPRDIYVYGEINKEMADAFVSQILALNKDDDGEITMHIASMGGSVYAGLRMYEAMQSSRSKIRTVCEGYCMSMGAFLLAVGDTRVAGQATTIMFHGVATSVAGKLPEIKAALIEVQRLQDILDFAISKRSGVPISEVSKMASYDHYMTSREAKSLGMIDVIFGGR